MVDAFIAKEYPHPIPSHRDCDCEQVYCEAIQPAEGGHAAGACKGTILNRPVVICGLSVQMCDGCFRVALDHEEYEDNIHMQRNACCDNNPCVCSGVRFVNVYFVNRQYGGPEEGGWYFDAGECVASFAMPNEESADQRRLELECKCAKEDDCDHEFSNEGRRPLSSVLSSGRYAVVIDVAPGEDFPAVRPHYE